MMLDKNGVEIRTGCIVEITGAYFKNDNGDPSWSGSDYCLKKIGKTGKISKAKYSTCFWPIMVFTTDRFKAAEAHEWNAAHAQIEVKAIKNMAEVASYFSGKAEALENPGEVVRRGSGKGKAPGFPVLWRLCGR